MKRIVNLENYDIHFCPLCNKNAKLPEILGGFNACVKCGGFGFVMREKPAANKRRESKRPRKAGPLSYQN